MISLSYSKLQTFEQCPLKFKFAYIDEIPSKLSPQLFLGQTVHSAIEEFYKMEDCPKTLSGIQNLFRSIWKKERNRYKVQNVLDMDKRTERESGLKGLDMLKNFFESPYNFPAYKTETFYKAFLNENVEFIGKIDRVEKSGESVKIVDYKTGKYSEKYLNFDQLYVYSWVLQQNNLEAVSSVFFFLGEKVIVEKKISSTLLSETERNLSLRTTLLIESLKMGSLPPKTSSLCPWCDFSSLCPEGGKYEKKY